MSEIETIKIDPDGKYVVLVKAEDPDHLLREQLELAEEKLKNWWRGDNKFIIFWHGDGIEVQFERVEEETGE